MLPDSPVVLNSPKRNHLLAVLPAPVYKRLLPHLQAVTLSLGEPVYEDDVMMDHVFFPTEGIISLLNVMKDGSSAEIAVTGNEGMVGIPLFMGGTSTTSRAVVTGAGHAYRLPAAFLNEEFERGSELQHLLLRFTQVLVTQMTQMAACNRHHAADKQLCRWLLRSLDRLPDNKLEMTQELIANIWVCAANVSPKQRDICS